MSQAGPLHGVRVLDLTRLLPGPVATGLLADLGADVVRIDENALSRAGMARDVMSGRDPESDAKARSVNIIGRGKRSVSLDYRTEAGATIVRRLAATADVLIEAYRPGVLDRNGLGYETLSAINERLIYCSMSGYGESGPYKDRPGHDGNYASIAGVNSKTSDGEGRPVGTGVPVVDLSTAYFTVIAVFAALRERESSGLGQRVQVPMLGAALHLSTMYLGRYFRDGGVPNRQSNDLLVLETADGRYLASQNAEQHFWRTFCVAIGRPEFAPPASSQFTELSKCGDQVRAIIKTKTRDEWMAIFGDIEVCVTPILEIDEVPLDPQVQHLEMVRELAHELYGTVRQTAFPILFGRTPWEFRGFAPALGQHNEEILQELGYGGDEIQALYDAGTIVSVEG